MTQVKLGDFVGYFKNHKGMENAVYSREIENHFGMHGTEVREMVNYLRMQGIPICSGNQGYWMAENESEVMKTLLNLTRRKQGLDNAIRGLMQCIERSHE